MTTLPFLWPSSTYRYASAISYKQLLSKEAFPAGHKPAIGIRKNLALWWQETGCSAQQVPQGRLHVVIGICDSCPMRSQLILIALLVVAPLGLLVGACGAGPAGSTPSARSPRSSRPTWPCGANLEIQQRRVLKRLLLRPAELGPGYVKASYGRPNPQCWTFQTAPRKIKRRLRGILRAGAGPQTRLCYFEYVRRGTHDDILVKVTLFPTRAEARHATKQLYVRHMNRRLARIGLPPVRRRCNLLFFVVGARSNKHKILEVHRRVSEKLGLQ